MTCSAYCHLTNSLPYYSHYHKQHFLYLDLVFGSFSFSYFYVRREETNENFYFFILFLTALGFSPLYIIQYIFLIRSALFRLGSMSCL